MATDNSALARGNRFLKSMNEDQRALFDSAYDAAVAAGDYDPAGFAAKGIIESNFNPSAVNKGGFTGLYQIDTRGGKTGNGIVLDDLVQADLMTKAEAGRINLKTPKDNMRVALLYRKRLYDMLGDGRAADVAFNAGPTITRKAMKQAGSSDPAALAKAMAKISPKVYGKAAKIREISEYQPAIAGLVAGVNESRTSRGLAGPGASADPGQIPSYAAGQAQLPGQGVPPPSVPAVPPAPGAPAQQSPLGVPPPTGVPAGDPLAGAQAPLYGSVGVGNTQPPLEGQQLQGPVGVNNSPGQALELSQENKRIPLPTESPDLRNALGQLAGGGLAYNIPLGGQFDAQARKSPLSTLDRFLDTLLDRA